MELKTAESSPDQRPVPVYFAPSMYRDDEINLIVVWKLIVKRKAIIFLTLLCSLLLSGAYMLLAQPVYKATAHLAPPHQKDVQGLLISRTYGVRTVSDLKRYTPEVVFAAFIGNLKSQGLRREFFDGHKLIDHYVSGKTGKNINVDEVFDRQFTQNLQIDVDMNTSAVATASFSGDSPELTAQWLNEFVVFANKRTLRQLLSDVHASIQAEINEVRYQLTSKLKLAEERRLDTIVSLKEALRVARALGIKEPSMFPMKLDKSQAALSVNTAEVPLYMRGTEALETQITVLESRKSDEPFIAEFRDLEERRVFLEGISIQANSLSAVTVDESARVPYRAERPRKVLILIVGLLFGLIGGLILAIVVEMFLKVQKLVKDVPA